jgi:hypothetical protein
VSGALPITYTWHKNFDFFTPYYEATLDSTNCTLVIQELPATRQPSRLQTKTADSED